jgi:hypothetical protein
MHHAIWKKGKKYFFLQIFCKRLTKIFQTIFFQQKKVSFEYTKEIEISNVIIYLSNILMNLIINDQQKRCNMNWQCFCKKKGPNCIASNTKK